MDLSATEKLLKKHFGITDFNEVIHKLENEPADTFKDNLFIDKESFIKLMKVLNNSINMLGQTYSDALRWSRSGSIDEYFVRSNIGYVKTKYIRQRKLMVHHLSFFFKFKK
jgi:hypothetical protein